VKLVLSNQLSGLDINAQFVPISTFVKNVKHKLNILITLSKLKRQSKDNSQMTKLNLLESVLESGQEVRDINITIIMAKEDGILNTRLLKEHSNYANTSEEVHKNTDNLLRKL
jgi:hypothetical protein